MWAILTWGVIVHGDIFEHTGSKSSILTAILFSVSSQSSLIVYTSFNTESSPKKLSYITYNYTLHKIYKNIFIIQVIQHNIITVLYFRCV